VAREADETIAKLIAVLDTEDQARAAIERLEKGHGLRVVHRKETASAPGKAEAVREVCPMGDNPGTRL
jgi:hypothetical protein